MNNPLTKEMPRRAGEQVSSSPSTHLPAGLRPMPCDQLEEFSFSGLARVMHYCKMFQLPLRQTNRPLGNHQTSQGRPETAVKGILHHVPDTLDTGIGW